MFGIERPTVAVNVARKTPSLLPLLCYVMVRQAQALQRAVPKIVSVIAMRLDMIRGIGRRDNSVFQAHGAKRMLTELLA